MTPLYREQLIYVPATMAPILSVVIHTEEEFDWSREFDRQATGVTHMRHIDRVQDLFDALRDRADVCRRLSDRGLGGGLASAATIGRRGPGPDWCAPSSLGVAAVYRNGVPRNSFPGNLPRDLEYEKLSRLTERIAGSFGTRPTVYLAGRYGNGPNSAQILEDLGYEVDVSVNVPMDFRDDHGPDYSARTNHPFWFGNQRQLLGLCYSGAFVGWLPAGKRLALPFQ